VIDDYVEFFEQSWDDAPRLLTALCHGVPFPVSRELYDKIAKVSCLHWFYPRAEEIIFPPSVFRFLTLIYERPPVVFQTMSMRKGSEEPLHIDTGPLTLTEPMSMVASWLALEDIKPNSGELEFVPGSHRLPEVLIHGVSKGHNGDMVEYDRVLGRIREMSEERGLNTERFAATKGDVLIWHADLMHGGAKIEDPNSTRQSLVAHFMPLGVMPSFYDYSQVSAVRYGNGGYCLDNYNFKTRPDPPATGLRRVKNGIPLPLRVFVRRQVDRVRPRES
jgi:phytanoyl-CoA hydroxylase